MKRRPGRPPYPRNERKSETLQILVTPTDRAELEAAIADSEITVSSFMRGALRHELNRIGDKT